VPASSHPYSRENAWRVLDPGVDTAMWLLAAKLGLG
jgi:hypothetical protein